MRYIALILVCCALYFIQAQLLPAIFHTNWLPNSILTAVVLVTIFKGRKMGLIAAVVGGSIHDILISNFFGLHLFPYMVVVYLLSLVKSSVYEERWYWSCGIIGVCTILDGIMRCIMISASGGDILFFFFIGGLGVPTPFLFSPFWGIWPQIIILFVKKKGYFLVVFLFS